MNRMPDFSEWIWTRKIRKLLPSVEREARARQGAAQGRGIFLRGHGSSAQKTAVPSL